MTKNERTTRNEGRKFAAFSICAGCLLCGTSALATVSYTYENDDKTLVATVTDADVALTTSAEEQAMFNNSVAAVKGLVSTMATLV